MSLKIFSVESRKGGVGKTTIALNLSECLRAKGYKVLYLDCDISGTPISRAVKNSSYWSNRTNPMMEDENRPSNLMLIFKNEFQNGRINGRGIVDKLNLVSNKINIISSDIYSDEGKLIIDPRNLMDETNSYWLMDMIKEIASAFEQKNEGRNTAIVIDNSPGYVGLGKSIREWLTTLGPAIGRFLLVSSLDEQDVEATLGSAQEICDLMSAKNDLAKKIGDKSRRDELRMMMDKDSSLSHFYYSLSKRNPYQSIDFELKNVNDYISIIFNKIPEILYDEDVSYELPKSRDEKKQKLIEDLITTDEKGFPSNVIYYDPIISEQFISTKLSSAIVGEKKENWKDFYKTRYDLIEKQKFESDSVKVAKSISQSYKLLKIGLQKKGYKNLSKTFSDVVDPSSVIPKFYSLLKSKISSVNSIVGHYYGGPLWNNDIVDMACLYTDNQAIQPYSSTIISLFEDIKKNFLNDINQELNPYVLTFMDMFVSSYFKSLEINFEDWKHSNRPAYKQFLLHEYNRKEEDIRVKNKVDLDDAEMQFFGKSVHFEKFFGKLYKELCYVILRLIDQVQDYNLLVKTYDITVTQSASRIMNKALKDYVLKVTKKQILFSESDLKDLLEKSLEMQAVHRVIDKNVLQAWSL